MELCNSRINFNVYYRHSRSATFTRRFIFNKQKYFCSNTLNYITSYTPRRAQGTSATQRYVEQINSANDVASSHTMYNIPDDAQQWIATPLEPIILNTKGKVARKTHYSFPVNRIRNVSVVAHVDHGKTTLTDAILRKGELLSATAPTSTFTDRLQVEKERGITIKAQSCSIVVTRRKHLTDSSNSNNNKNSTIKELEEEQQEECSNLAHKVTTSLSELNMNDNVSEHVISGDTCEEKEERYLINLIDTPGHVDFQYEVSRSLHASEGVLLLIDVRQGLQAQTMAHFNEAIEQGLEIIPVFTKMDLVMSDDEVNKTLRELEDSTGLLEREVLFTSAVDKRGIEQLFDAIINRIPAPSGRVGSSD